MCMEKISLLDKIKQNQEFNNEQIAHNIKLIVFASEIIQDMAMHMVLLSQKIEELEEKVKQLEK